jgi:hypothetical protein
MISSNHLRSDAAALGNLQRLVQPLLGDEKCDGEDEWRVLSSPDYDVNVDLHQMAEPKDHRDSLQYPGIQARRTRSDLR